MDDISMTVTDRVRHPDLAKAVEFVPSADALREMSAREFYLVLKRLNLALLAVFDRVFGVK
jgi:hypothetical protein